MADNLGRETIAFVERWAGGRLRHGGITADGQRLDNAGQTIGKLILKIAIVDHIDGMPPGFVRAALIRQLPLMVVSLFTPAFILGYLFVDGSLIFRPPRRCVHDYIAGTIVINVTSDGTAVPAAAHVPKSSSPVREVTCWSCKSPIAVTSETRGSKVACPTCGTKQWLPI